MNPRCKMCDFTNQTGSEECLKCNFKFPKPCPFCGNDDIDIVVPDYSAAPGTAPPDSVGEFPSTVILNPGGYFACFCHVCRAQGPEDEKSLVGAVSWWNNRTTGTCASLPAPIHYTQVESRTPTPPVTDLKIRALEAIGNLTHALSRYEENQDFVSMVEGPPSVGLEIKKLGEIGLSLAEMVKREISDKPTNQ